MIKVAPRIDKLNFKPVTVKAGQPIVLEAQFVAEPEPTYVWSSEHCAEYLETDRNQMTIDTSKAKLVIQNAKRSETGKYYIKLTNGSGSDTASCDVIVLCKHLKFFIQLFKIFN